MTEGPTPESIAEAVTLIDEGLLELRSRELTRSDQMADLLLDLRLLLISSPLDQQAETVGAP